MSRRGVLDAFGMKDKRSHDLQRHGNHLIRLSPAPQTVSLPRKQQGNMKGSPHPPSFLPPYHLPSSPFLPAFTSPSTYSLLPSRFPPSLLHFLLPSSLSPSHLPPPSFPPSLSFSPSSPPSFLLLLPFFLLSSLSSPPPLPRRALLSRWHAAFSPPSLLSGPLSCPGRCLHSGVSPH